MPDCLNFSASASMSVAPWLKYLIIIISPTTPVFAMQASTTRLSEWAIIAFTWSKAVKPSVSPGWLQTYTFFAFVRKSASVIPSAKRFGIMLVYKLPGPKTTISASSMTSMHRSNAQTCSGSPDILLIRHLCSNAAFGMLDSPKTSEPSSKIALRSASAISPFAITAVKKSLKASDATRRFRWCSISLTWHVLRRLIISP